MKTKIENCYLGCPMWANKDWIGEVFTRKAKPKDYLRQYAKALNTVEGNTTFYALPKAETVRRWNTDTPDDFRFCFKFPRLISHVHKLRHTQGENLRFFKAIEPLEAKIGLLFLQLPPSFSGQHLRQFRLFLAELPSDFSYAVEVRHLDFFDEGEREKQFNELLQEHRINRVMFDTSVLHGIQTEHEGIVTAQSKKPKMPSRYIATAQQPFLRFVGHMTIKPNLPHLETLAAVVADWIERNLTPYVFMHSPGGDVFAPQLCRRFHELLSQKVKSGLVGEMPPFPADDEKNLPQQMKLF